MTAYASVWVPRPGFPPATVRAPEEYTGGPHLALACTQTDLPAKAQKQLVADWCALLPTLHAVRVLWLYSRVPQALFEAACRMPQLEGLYIKWSGITDLQPLGQLQALQHLHLGSSPSAAPLGVLGELPALVSVRLHNIRAASDLGFVAGMPQLRALTLTGDTHGPKPLKLDTLGPLVALQQLEYLCLAAIRVGDGSLAPLQGLKALRQLDLANQFSLAEVAALAGQRPDLACDLFNPLSEPVNWMRCKRCQQHRLVMPTGKGLPWLCLDCDAQRVERLCAEFEAIRAGQTPAV